MIFLVLDYNVYDNFGEELANTGKLITLVDKNISLSERISLSAIKLQELLIENKMPLALSTIPVLTIMTETIDVLENIKLLANRNILPDMVFFDNLIHPSIVCASLAATIQIFKSVNKFDRLFRSSININADVRSRTAWYAQRIGFKVYEKRM